MVHDGGTALAKGVAAAPASAADKGPPDNVKGIVAMLAAMAVFALGDVAMKAVAVAGMPTGEAVFIRGAMGLAMIGSYLLATGLAVRIKRYLSLPVLLRSIGDIGAALFFQNGLARMPLADAAAILQVNPLMVTAAAAVFLRERVGWRRWTATMVGLAGMLLILKPGTSAFNPWGVLLLISTCFTVLRDLATRRIDPSMPPLLITGVSTLAVTVFSLFAALFETWQAPGPAVLMWLALAALSSAVGQLCVVVSIRSGEVSAVVPFRYSFIIWATLMSFLLWGDLPDVWTVAGVLIVVGAGLYVFFREQALARRGARP